MEPARHGILSNTYVPQVHTVQGLFEKIRAVGGVNAIFYGWEPMRDVAPEGTCQYATYINSYTDEKGGHDNGWMSEEHLRRIRIAIENVKRVVDACGEVYTVIITADHGGHERSHGTDMAEDMTIPVIFIGKRFEKGKCLEGGSILNLAPTVASIMGLVPEHEWEGQALV